MKSKLIAWCVGIGICFTLFCAAVFPSWRDQQLNDAVERGNAGRVAALLRYGANPNVDVCTHTNSAEWFDWLPVKMQPQKCAGFSPLLLAAIRANKPKTPLVVAALLKHGANVNASMPTYEQTALDVAAKQNNLATAQVLLSYGAGSRRNELNQALTESEAHKDFAMFRLLFAQKGNHLSSGDKNGWLLNLGYFGNVKTIDFLLEQGVKINAPNSDSQTVLMEAARHCQTKTVEIFLSHGANPNVQDKDGNTALHYALDSTLNNVGEVRPVVELLQQNGASLVIKNKKGKTPAELLQLDRKMNKWVK